MSKEIVYSLLKNCPFFSATERSGRKIREEEVKPYDSINDALELLKLSISDNLPLWVSNTKPLASSTLICCAVTDCDSGEKRMFYKRTDKPKTLVCHDYRGNYHDFDCQSVPCADSDLKYEFKHWMGIDIFVYFSHHLITVPPPHWINQAHNHGVAILGTLITEGDEGKALCDEFFQSEKRWKWFAEVLNAIAVIHKFDGYLINIENILSTAQVSMMIDFLAYLRSLMLKTSHLIWYDAVTIDGKLSWQDCLNEHNEVFFNACDGIFLNYNIDAEKLQKSALTAGKRNHDVYVGVDVFGRSKAPGRFSTADGFAMARSLDLSVALFAPGWTIESSPGGSPLVNDFIFWTSLRPYLYFHGVKQLIGNQCENQLCFNTPPPADALAFRNALIRMVAMDKLEDPLLQRDTAADIYCSLPAPLMSFNPNDTSSAVFRNAPSSVELQLLVLEIVLNKDVIINFTSDYTASNCFTPSFFVTVQGRDKQLIRITLETGEKIITTRGILVELGSNALPEINIGAIIITLSEDSARLDILVLKTLAVKTSNVAQSCLE